MRSIVIHPEAEEELLDAARYYEACHRTLGSRFLDAVVKGLEAVAESPLSRPVLSGRVRRYLIERFPYGLLYVVLPDAVTIVAVMHLHRRPGYRRGRLQ
jgi:plasmid stabilization system protein ParE